MEEGVLINGKASRTNAIKRATWCLPDIREFDLIREVREFT